MTTSRVVRGTKGRIFFYIAAVLIITGVIACYNGTLTQLDEVQKARDQCHQQQENLSTQLQVIFDYKQRLEKSLKAEKAEHQQTKNDFENKLLEEKAQNEKTAKDDDLKFSALQQHYNLLKTQHEDFKEECSKAKKEQLNQVNDLQGKLKEVRSAFEQLKNKYEQLKVEKNTLDTQLKEKENDFEINQLTKENQQLQKEIEDLRTKYYVSESAKVKKSAGSNTNFSKQVEVESSVFQMQMGGDKDVGMSIDQISAPKSKNDDEMNNSQNVLPAPNNVGEQANLQVKSSTGKTKDISKGQLNAVAPLLMPTVTPSSVAKFSPEVDKNSNVLPLPYANQKLPDGVVPVPNSVVDQPKIEKSDNIDNLGVDDVKADALPNRYRNNIIENENVIENKPAKEAKQAQVDDISKNLVDTKDDNNALEVFDPPLNNDNKIADDPLFGGDENQNEKPENQEVDHKKIKPKFEDPAADPALEENEEGEEDDDVEDYVNREAHLNEPAVRH